MAVLPACGGEYGSNSPPYVLETLIAVDQCTMENGMTKSSAPVDLSTNDVVYPDVTTTVAQLVDDDWLFEEDVSCSKTMAVKAKKAKVKKYFSEHCVA